jgi:hypothetical protein
MRSKWIAAGVSALAMALPATAMAGTQDNSPGGGTGQAQLSGQAAATLQAAESRAQAAQNAVNTNAPVNVAGRDINGAGNDNATQNATNVALSAALNRSKTDQSNSQTQIAGPSGSVGSGGTGQAQGSSQWAATLQGAESHANADQNAVNANAPSNTAGRDINGGGNDNATQHATNAAGSAAANGSHIGQSNSQYQDPRSGQSQSLGGGSKGCGCSPSGSGSDSKGSGFMPSGSGGTGQIQGNSQWAATLQAAQSQARAKQNAVNTNAPVNVAGRDINGAGGDNATQHATNLAGSAALNGSRTGQSNEQTQIADPSCLIGCGGAGQAQFNDQSALTGQYAASRANADQNTVNANVPVNIAGRDINGAGGDNATQNTTNAAGSLAGNLAGTHQSNSQDQMASSSCLFGCGGTGQAQFNDQNALTAQAAASSADAGQNAVNANVPVNIAGRDINGAGNDNATQNATNLAGSAALNGSHTSQSNSQDQTAGSSCLLGCGGTGQAQLSGQGAFTGQYAASQADAHQNAVNANVPVNVAGRDINGAGNDNATQGATNAGGSLAGNLSGTGQKGGETQSTGSGVLV